MNRQQFKLKSNALILVTVLLLVTACQNTSKKNTETVLDKEVLQENASSTPYKDTVERELKGTYWVMAYTVTKQAKKDKISFASVPKFEFLEGQRVKIEPDFEFGLFKDSVYDYTLKESKIIFEGSKGKIEAQLERVSRGLTLYFNTIYISKLSLVKDDDRT